MNEFILGAMTTLFSREFYICALFIAKAFQTGSGLSWEDLQPMTSAVGGMECLVLCHLDGVARLMIILSTSDL